MYSKLTASFRERIVTGVIFIITLMLFLTASYVQYVTPFILSLFFVSLFFLIVAGIACFFFLQSIICPKLQVYDKFIIITGLKRMVIQRNSIKECLITNNEVVINYTHNGLEQRIQIKVREDASHIIKLIRK